MAVDAGNAHGLGALHFEQVDKALVYFSGEHHLHDVHGFLVRHPQTVDKFGFFADFSEQLGDFGTSAVYEHDFDADEIE